MASLIYTWVNKIRATLMISITAFTVVLCLLQVALRYFTFISFRPFAWGDEIVRLCSIWVIFLGVSLGIRENSHFAVDLFLNKIRSTRIRSLVERALDVSAIGVFIIIAYQGFLYTSTNTTSLLQNIHISMAWFYAAIPVGSLLCLFEYGYRMVWGKSYKQHVLITKKGEQK
ncbi:MAG: TRAP transporter small permease subunit [Sphaerochaeta sp.]